MSSPPRSVEIQFFEFYFAGEIVVGGDHLAVGYFNMPEQTASDFFVDSKGHRWFKTGDIGKLDENGYLYVLDRKDDMIISGGFNIWPAELENAILGHPEVVEVAVFAIPHERWGESPAAMCVVADGAKVTADDIKNDIKPLRHNLVNISEPIMWRTFNH